MPLPELDAEARRQALEKAAEARKVRAELKQQLKVGKLSFSDVLDRADGDEIVGKTRVDAVLQSMPRLGKVRARELMERCGIAPSRRLRGLGAKQRAQLLHELEGDQP